MLVEGWWGIIGLLMPQVNFVQNLHYLTRIVTGSKVSPRHEQTGVLGEGVWPPRRWCHNGDIVTVEQLP